VNPEKVKPSLSQLEELLSEFDYGCRQSEIYTKKWCCKARLLKGSTWVMHGEDGQIKAVAVFLQEADICDAVKIDVGVHWAFTLRTKLVVVHGKQVITVPVEEELNYYVGPRGLVADLTPYLKVKK